MSAAQTSLLAYISVQPELNHRQAVVYQVIQDYAPISNMDIATALDIPINTVTPRVLELRAKGLVKEAHKDRHPRTGRLVSYWRAA